MENGEEHRARSSGGYTGGGASSSERKRMNFAMENLNSPMRTESV